MRRFAWMLALVVAGCGGDPSGGQDLSGTPDLSGPTSDLKPPDLATQRDLAMADLATPDLAMPDLATPDLAMLDLATPDLAMPDLAMPDFAMPDLAMPDLNTSDLTVIPDLVPPPDIAKPCHPVVNEIMTRAGNSGFNEFVEIYNPCQKDFDLTGWKLVGRSAVNVNPVGGADTNTLFGPWNNVTLLQGTYLVYGGAAFGGLMDAKLLVTIGDQGAIGIRDAQNGLVDSVAYGPLCPLDGGGTCVAQANAFIETLPAPGPAADQSIGRFPNGTDSDDNSKDFKPSQMVTPKAANQ